MDLDHGEELHDELVVRNGESVGGLLHLRLLKNARGVCRESGNGGRGGERGVEGEREGLGFARAVGSEDGGKEKEKAAEHDEHDERIVPKTEQCRVEAATQTIRHAAHNSKAAESLSPKVTCARKRSRQAWKDA